MSQHLKARGADRAVVQSHTVNPHTLTDDGASESAADRQAGSARAGEQQRPSLRLLGDDDPREITGSRLRRQRNREHYRRYHQHP
jgi:hypothetical protein